MKLNLIGGSVSRAINNPKKILARARRYEFDGKNYCIVKRFTTGNIHFTLFRMKNAQAIYPAIPIDGSPIWGNEKMTWKQAETKVEKRLNRELNILGMYNNIPVKIR